MVPVIWIRSVRGFVASVALLSACGGAGSGESRAAGGGAGLAGDAGAAAQGGSAGTSGAGQGGSAATSGGAGGTFFDGGFGGSAAVGGGGATGNEALCNGIDDDGNGIVDDVDKGKDGICDCLKIATLGVAGPWGQGDVFASWLTARSDFGATDLAGQTLTSALLQDFQVIVAQNLSVIGRSYAPVEADALEEWVRAGGGLMTLIGYGAPSELMNANFLLQRFGHSYGSQQILPKLGGSTVPITGWIPHPVSTGVSRVGVDNGYAAQGGTAIAGEQGHTLLAVSEPTSGRVAVWGDEWITYNSEWSGHPDYQVELFWVNVIKWLTPTAVCQVPVPPDVH